jgi:photosystem II stability/assembly factor-like uncharacterized protein
MLGAIPQFCWFVATFTLLGCQTVNSPSDYKRPVAAIDDGRTVLNCPDNGSRSEQDVAQSLGLSLDVLHSLVQNRRRSIDQLCKLKPERLAHEVSLALVRRPYGPSDEEFRASRLRNADGSIDPDFALKNASQRLALESKPKAAGPQPSDVVWQSIGPGNIGGRVRSVLVDATDQNRVLIGAVTGGIWLSVDGGAHWQSVTDPLGDMEISWLAQDPNDPATLYATTGEYYNGVGILVSRDHGNTWNFLSIGPVPASARKIVAIPGLPQVLVTTNSGGLYRSQDDGNTWTQVRPGSVTVASSPQDINEQLYDLKLDPFNAAHLIAGSYTAGTITQSFDAGQTWSPPIKVSISPKNGQRVEVQFSRSQSGLVFATVSPAISDPPPQRTAFYESRDGAATWAFVSNVADLHVFVNANSNGSYNNVLWIDPTNSKNIIAGDVYLNRSTDGGNTWTAINDWATDPTAANSRLAYLHFDSHAIAVSAQYDGRINKRMWFGNDGGVYRTDDVTTAQFLRPRPPNPT